METTIDCVSYPLGIPVGPLVRRGWDEAVGDDHAPRAVVVAVVYGGEAAADGEGVAAEEEEQDEEGPPHEVNGVGDVGPAGPSGLQKSWLSSGFDCPAGSTETMRLVDCTHHGCLLEVLFEDTWGSVCSRGFKEYTAQLTCGMLGFPHGGTLNPARGDGASVVWLSEV